MLRPHLEGDGGLGRGIAREEIIRARKYQPHRSARGISGSGSQWFHQSKFATKGPTYGDRFYPHLSLRQLDRLGDVRANAEHTL